MPLEPKAWDYKLGRYIDLLSTTQGGYMQIGLW